MRCNRLADFGAIENQVAILDALPAQIALLDAEGNITSVNRAWRQFGASNGLLSPGQGVGVNYLSICDQTRGEEATLAHRAATGIREVLEGRAPSFSMEYPCHSSVEQRWFVMTATPLADVRQDGVLVMHQAVTAERLAEVSLRDSELRFRQLAENIQDVFFLGDLLTSRLLYISPSYAEIWGRSCDSLYANPQSWIEAIHPDDRAAVEGKYEAALSSGRVEFECRIVRPDGSIRWIHSRGFPVSDDSGAIVRLAGVVKDITGRKQALDVLEASETGQRNLVQQLEAERARLVAAQRVAKIGSWETDLATLATIWSEETHRIHETDPSIFDPTHQGFIALIHPADREAVASAFAQSLDQRHANAITHRLLLADGRIRHVEERWQIAFDAQGKAVRAFGTCQDVTDRKQAEFKIEHLNRVDAVLSQINALTVRARDRDELFRETCRIAVETGGFRMAMIAMVDQATSKIVPIATAGKGEDLLQAIRNVLASDEKAPTTMAAKAIRDKTANVSNDMEIDQRPLLRENYTREGVRSFAVLPLVVADEAVGILALYAVEKDFFREEEMKLLMGLADDVAFAIDHIEKEERLTYLAYYDATTGLANQTLFLKRFQENLLASQPSPSGKAAFVLDIERFKTINDTFGQEAGDNLLKQIAERLVQVGGGDASRFARLSGDRFVICASDMGNAEQIGLYLEQRLSATFDAPFRVRDNDLRISVKVGIALFPDDGVDGETLLHNAEAALKKAKATGERYLFFNHAMTARVAERLSLENRLRQALDKEEFVLHYQPKLNLATRELTGAEALIRWNDPRTGLVPPDMFIPILEETGMIHAVGRLAMRMAIADYRRWRCMGLMAVRVAVNVSPLQLRNRGFIAEIRQALGNDARAAGGLELEITESLAMEDVKHSIEVLHAIREIGVTIAIDDFGSGFSSLSYLSKLPMDTLKIDHAFVNDMTATPRGLALVSTIITLAHSLQHKVVAEGVETHEQWDLLQSLGCDEMQGFLISKPVPTEVFEKLFLSPEPGSECTFPRTGVRVLPRG